MLHSSLVDVSRSLSSSMSGSMSSPKDEDEERQPLLSPKQVTPLPKLQLLAVCGMRFTCPMLFYVIYAYISPMLIELGIATEKYVGFYSGTIEGVFWLFNILTVCAWGWLSDRTGRKPVLLAPFQLAALASLAFGFGHSFAVLLLLRSVQGLMNGPEAVVKTVLAEMTDETNQAQAFAVSSLAWQMAGTLAPLLGGFASRPAERFRLFDTDFFRSYPYFLPTAVAAVFPVAASILGLFALKETLPPRKKEKDRPPVSTLFTRRLILVLSAWGSICLVHSALNSVFVLFCFASNDTDNGLSLTPRQIGLCLSLNSIVIILFEPLVGPILFNRYGKLRLLRLVSPAFALFFALMPLVRLASLHLGRAGTVGGLFLLLVLNVAGHLVFLCGDLISTNAAPDRRLLGTFNSLQQLFSGVGMLVGVMGASYLWSAMRGGLGVTILLVGASMVSQALIARLDEGGGWREGERDA